MKVIFYIIGVIIVLCIFFVTHKKERLTWKKLIIGILTSFGSWFTIIAMTMILIFISIIFFIDWFSNLEFWNKEVF